MSGKKRASVLVARVVWLAFSAVVLAVLMNRIRVWELGRSWACPAAGLGGSPPPRSPAGGAAGPQIRGGWIGEENGTGTLSGQSAYSAVALNSEYFFFSPCLDLENRRLRESASESFDVWPVLWRGQLYYLVQLPACWKTGTDYLHLVRKFAWCKSGSTGATWGWESTSSKTDHCWFPLTKDP